MSHELTIRAGGKVEMAFTGENPWHGLGQSLPVGADLDEWQVAAGMDWRIDRAKVRYPARAEDAGNPAAWRAMDDRHVLLRSDNGDALGVVSSSYQEVQPADVLGFFRDLTKGAGFEMETAGTLFGGKRFWALARVTADAPILDAKDKVGGFLLLSTSADGSLSTEARFTTVRVVCKNTLGMAREKRAEVKVSHRAAFDPDAAKEALGVRPQDMRERFETQMEQFRRLARSRATPAEMVRMTLEAFGHDPDAMSRDDLEKAARAPAAAAIGTLAVSGDGLMGADLSGGSRTAWSWLNAVTQYVDHGARARSQSNRLDSAWFGRGDALKMKAQEIAIRHAGGAVLYAPEQPAGGSLLDDVLAATPVAA